MHRSTQALVILLVEDDESVRRGWTRILHAKYPDIRILEADSLAAAQHVIRDEPVVSAAIIDGMLRESEGADVVQWLRSDPRRARMILVAASGERRLNNLMVTHGANDFAEKWTAIPTLERLLAESMID